MSAEAPPTRVTVFTGFLGSGKTTIILSLLAQLPPDHRVAILKNEFGDVAVDSLLVKDSSLAVQEMLNGCLCCVLVGQMENGLLELREKYNPSHIIVEASGSAFPAAVAWQIRSLPAFILDSIVTVVDCVNFDGYADRSPTASMQAKYTDLILLNKHELVDERRLDQVIDRVNDLNTDTPRIKTNGIHGVSPDLILGIAADRHQQPMSESDVAPVDADHMSREVDLIQVQCDASADVDVAALEKLFSSLPGDQFFRIKGFLRLPDGSARAFNYAFGRAGGATISSAPEGKSLQLVFMGSDLAPFVKRIQAALKCNTDDISFTPQHDHHHH